jgi:hypothetical protein
MNWTKEVTEKLVAAYESNKDLSELAKEFDTTVPSVRGKLVAEKVYVSTSKPKANRTASKPKAELVSAMETILSVPVGSFASFENATKSELELAVETLISLGDRPL